MGAIRWERIYHQGVSYTRRVPFWERGAVLGTTPTKRVGHQIHPLRVYSLASIEKYQPCGDGEKGKKKLPRNRE